MKAKYVNFTHLLVCSIAFFGLYSSMFTSQNLSSQLFEKDGYD